MVCIDCIPFGCCYSEPTSEAQPGFNEEGRRHVHVISSEHMFLLGRSVLHEKVASFFDPCCLFKPIQNLLVHKKFEDLYKRNDLQDTMPPEVLYLPMFSFINCVWFWASGNASTYAYVDMLIYDICADFSPKSSTLPRAYVYFPTKSSILPSAFLITYVNVISPKTNNS